MDKLDLIVKSVKKVRCPKCNSRIRRACVDWRGQALATPHRERVEKYVRHKALIRKQMAQARSSRMTVDERETYRQNVRSAVPCPECGAGIGEKCIGRNEHRRLSVHAPRIVAMNGR